MKQGYETWTVSGITRRLERGQKLIIKGWCKPGQSVSDHTPAVCLVVTRLPAGELLSSACSGPPPPR